MNVDLQADFDYELSIHQFPFLSIFKKQKAFLAALRAEFAALTPRPKLHWYFRQFISDEEWAQKSGDPGMEQRGRKIITDFDEAVKNNNISEKLFGRLVSETQTVMLLMQLEKKINIFKKYVFDDPNRDNYKAYARAAAKSMILLCNKITIPGLGLCLLQEIADMDVESDITIYILLMGIDQVKQDEIRNNFEVLKTMADELINEEIGKQSLSARNPRFLMQREPARPNTTMADRTLRELSIILNLFQAQYAKYDPTDSNPYPMILGRDGRSGIDGSYIQHIDILSDCELFNVQRFKEHITERFEQSNNHILLKSQLSNIRSVAQIALEFYNQKLTKSNPIIQEFLSDHSRPFQDRQEEWDKYSAMMTVYNYQIGSIYIGIDGHSTDRRAMHIPQMEFNYPTDNYSLATVCQHIFDFIEQLNPANSKLETSAKKSASHTLLFRNELDKQPCLDLLKDVKPAVVDEHGNFSLTERKKAAVVAWYNALDAAHKINNSIPPDRRTELILEMIPNLKITTRVFRNKHGVYSYYFPLFQKMVAVL